MTRTHELQGTVQYKNWQPRRVEIRDGAVLCQPSGESITQNSWRGAPPHVELANLLVLDEGAVKKFVSKHGVLRATALPKTRTGGFLNAEEQMQLLGVFGHLSEFEKAQKLLRSAWRGDISPLKSEIKDGFELLSFDLLRQREVLFETEDLWKFIVFLFLLDYKRGKTGVCSSPDCPAPYFLRSRKGQGFCSHACAVLINVRRFRERQSAGKVVRKGRRKD